MLTASKGSPVPVDESTLDKAVPHHAVEHWLVQMVPALAMHTEDRTCGHGDDACAGVGDAGAGLRLK